MIVDFLTSLRVLLIFRGENLSKIYEPVVFRISHQVRHRLANTPMKENKNLENFDIRKEIALSVKRKRRCCSAMQLLHR